jgi:hypothetical protein
MDRTLLYSESQKPRLIRHGMPYDDLGMGLLLPCRWLPERLASEQVLPVWGVARSSA